MQKNQSPEYKPTVCVDLDGTLASSAAGTFDIDKFGDPLPGSQELTWGLSEKYNVMIFTCRCNPDLPGRPEGEPLSALKARVCSWLDDNGYYYNDVWTGVGKPIAVAYIDDRAIRIRPENGGRYEYEYALARLGCYTGIEQFQLQGDRT